MWAILEFCLLAAIVLLSITEFFYPLLTGKPLFGSFRKKIETDPTQQEPSLEEKISKAKEKVKEVKNVQEEINQKFKSAEQLKAQADDLLNNENN